MARFTLKIDCDNAAFDAENCGAEIADILAQIARDVRPITHRDYANTRIRDTNGNTVGEWKYNPRNR